MVRPATWSRSLPHSRLSAPTIRTSRLRLNVSRDHQPVADPPTSGGSPAWRGHSALKAWRWQRCVGGWGQDVREGMGGWSGGQASRSRKLERRGRLAWPRLGLHAEWYLRADEPGRGANPQARDRAHFGAPLHTPLRGGRRVWLGRPVRQDTSEFERDSQVQAPAVNGRIERFLDLLDPFDDGIPV